MFFWFNICSMWSYIAGYLSVREVVTSSWFILNGKGNEEINLKLNQAFPFYNFFLPFNLKMKNIFRG